MPRYVSVCLPAVCGKATQPNSISRTCHEYGLCVRFNNKKKNQRNTTENIEISNRNPKITTTATTTTTNKHHTLNTNTTTKITTNNITKTTTTTSQTGQHQPSQHENLTVYPYIAPQVCSRHRSQVLFLAQAHEQGFGSHPQANDGEGCQPYYGNSPLPQDTHGLVCARPITLPTECVHR